MQIRFLLKLSRMNVEHIEEEHPNVPKMPRVVDIEIMKTSEL